MLEEEEAHQQLMREAGMVEITPQQFLYALYPDDEIIPITQSGVDGGRGTYQRCERQDVFKYIRGKTDAYIFPVRFFNEVPRSELLKDLQAFVVDLDDIAFGGLKELIKAINENPELRPTHIVRTGNGVHLYYILDRGIECRKLWMRGLKEISSALYNFWEKNAAGCYADKHCKTVPHSFRVPGSLCKDGERVATAWQVDANRESISLEPLLNNLNCHPRYIQRGAEPAREIDFYNQDELHEERKLVEEWKKVQLAKKAKRNITIDEPGKNRRPWRHPGLFWYSYERTRNMTRKGWRYLSCWSLASLGYTCGIERSVVEECLMELVELWSASKDPVKPSEIENAMRGYSPRWVRLSRATREELFGWRYEGESVKRNYGDKHHTRSEHMMRVNRKRRSMAEGSVRDYLREFPDATIKQVSDDLEIAYSTAQKYMKLIWDERSDNEGKNRREEITKNKVRRAFEIMPNATIQQIANEAGVSYATAQKWLKRIKEDR